MTPPPPFEPQQGRLTAVRLAGVDKQRRIVWQCNCSCGNSIRLPAQILKTGLVKSCGCEEREIQRLTTLLAEAEEVNRKLTKLLQEERPSLLFRLLQFMGKNDGK